MLIQRATLIDGRTVDIRLADRIEEVADRLTPGRKRRRSTPPGAR